MWSEDNHVDDYDNHDNNTVLQQWHKQRKKPQQKPGFAFPS